MSSTLSPPRRTSIPREDYAFSIPHRAATSLAGFRDWYATDDFPDEGRISYLAGEIFFDMSHERLSSHVSLKGEITRALIGVAHDLGVGQFYTDGVRVVNEAADVSHEPDGCYLTWAAVTSGRVELHRSADGLDVTEVIGAPDMVLEIVSPSSARKDATILPELYHRAAIPEYWLIDARGDEIEFDVFLYSESGYTPVVPAGGWRNSPAFARRFRLERFRNPIGLWDYRLLSQLPE